MSTKKQSTLAAFGFTKSVFHRGQETVIDIPKTVSEDEYQLECVHCLQIFKNKQGLYVHMKCKHGNISTVEHLIHKDTSESQKYGETSGAPASTESTESEVIEILETTQTVENRQGSDVRKSFNNRFKASAIPHVENGEKAIDVAEKFNFSRVQISKWLKMKDTIFRAAVDENKKLRTRLKSTMSYTKL